jgi:hypothetical protein
VALAAQELPHLTQDHQPLMLVVEAEASAILEPCLELLQLVVPVAAELVAHLVVLELQALQILAAVAVQVLAVTELLLERLAVQAL